MKSDTSTSVGAVISVRLAAEFDFALERNGLTAAHVKKMATGNTLTQLLPFLEGRADIVIRQYVIDADADPFIPEGWKGIEEHRKGGQLVWDPTKIELHLDEDQRDGKRVGGHELRKRLKSQPVLNACVMDFLLQHPELIPEEWKGKAVFFWGTIYRHSDGSLCVRYLDWSGDEWDWDYYWLLDGFDGNDPAAVSAK